MKTDRIGEPVGLSPQTGKRSKLEALLCSAAVDIAMLVLWVGALAGYFGPWIARRPAGGFYRPSAALSWNAYDLFDLLRLLPEIESAALTVNLQALQLPLLALVILLPVLVFRSPALVRAGAAALGSGLATLTLPPYPEIITAWKTPGWCVPFWWGVGGILCAWVAVWAAPRIGKARHWLCMGAAELVILPAAVTLARLLPALGALHAAPVRPGWGFWCCVIGLGLIGVLAGLKALGATDGRHP